MATVLQARARVGRIVDGAGPVPWDDAGAALDAAGRVLDEVAGEPGLLPALVAEVSTDERGACESYPLMDKLVLWRSDDGATRLRLHVFSPGYGDRPHNHRWSFVSSILRGRYAHSVYGSEDDVLRTVRSAAPVRPVLVHDERVGSRYFLDHALVHSLRTDVLTVSLLLRGPAVKPEYFTIDRAAAVGSEPPPLVLSTGDELEGVDVRASKAMSPARLAAVVAVLRGEGLA